MKRIAILGSTGSIGTQRARGRRRARRSAAGRRPRGGRERRAARGADRALSSAHRRDGDRRGDRPADAARDRSSGVTIAGSGRDGLVAVASHPDADIVLCASSGTEALEAVLAAIEQRKTIALANKEVLVMAGGIVTEAAARHGVAILPVDSEHNAIHQCLHGRARGDVRRLILTASGGPFRGRSASDLTAVSAADALKHPTWRMGRKITIDSATLMNKGLEVIEAHWLFGVRRIADRRRHPPAVGRAFDGRADRRLDHRAARRHRHAAADSVRVFVSGSVDRAAAAARSDARRAARVRGAGHRGVPVPAAWRIGRSRRSAACRSC